MERRDPRYVETSPDERDWAKVRFVEMFDKQRTFEGLLYDLTHRAVRVLLDKEEKDIFTGGIGKRALVTFKVGKEVPLTVSTAIVGRAEELNDKTAVVLFFDILKEPDREAIGRLCERFAEKARGEERTDNS